MAFADTAQEILNFLINNHVRQRDEQNYLRNIARELDISVNHVNNLLNMFEEICVVRRVREGQKKVVYVNSSIVEAFKKKKEMENNSREIKSLYA